MKRVTGLFDDERLYREVKAEAARDGRPVKDVIAEALRDWLGRHPTLSAADRQRLQAALEMSDRLLSRQPVRDTIQKTLDELREERS